jgi:hypothetical protein
MGVRLAFLLIKNNFCLISTFKMSEVNLGGRMERLRERRWVQIPLETTSNFCLLSEADPPHRLSTDQRLECQNSAQP